MWTHPEFRPMQDECRAKIKAKREAVRQNADARARCYEALVRHFAPVTNGNGNH